MANLVNGLGGESGFGENSISRNDDGYSSAIDITSIFENGINLFDTTYDSVYVNTNGNITFDRGLYTYSPTEISAGSSPIIAPFWADVDTRSGTVTASNGSGSNVDYSLNAYREDLANDTLYYEYISVVSSVLNYDITTYNLSSLSSFEAQVKERTGWDDTSTSYSDDALDSVFNFLEEKQTEINTELGDSNYNSQGNSTGSNLVWYDIDETTQTLTVTWDDVGYYDYNMDKTNAFQLQLKNTGTDTFDMNFIYEDINWTTGDASDGSNGLGGVIARAGYSAGDDSHYYELPFSGNQAGMLDIENYQVSGQSEAGIWKLSILEGAVQGIGLEESDDTIAGTDSADILDGRSGNDILDGGEGNDVLNGGLGNDVFFTGVGNDTVYGGDGDDSVVYTNNLNAFDFSTLSDYFEVRNNNNTSVDSIYDVDTLTFADTSIAIEDINDLVSLEQSVTRLYNALLGRNPDNAGLNYWLGDINGAGNSVQGISTAFNDSEEYLARFGAQSNEEFINQLYNNILQRDADQAGYDYWLDEIAHSGDRSGMIVSFSEADEFIVAQAQVVENYLNSVDLSTYIA